MQKLHFFHFSGHLCGARKTTFRSAVFCRRHPSNVPFVHKNDRWICVRSWMANSYNHVIVVAKRHTEIAGLVTATGGSTSASRGTVEISIGVSARHRRGRGPGAHGGNRELGMLRQYPSHAVIGPYYQRPGDSTLPEGRFFRGRHFTRQRYCGQAFCQSIPDGETSIRLRHDQAVEMYAMHIALRASYANSRRPWSRVIGQRHRVSTKLPPARLL